MPKKKQEVRWGTRRELITRLTAINSDLRAMSDAVHSKHLIGVEKTYFKEATEKLSKITKGAHRREKESSNLLD